MPVLEYLFFRDVVNKSRVRNHLKLDVKDGMELCTQMIPCEAIINEARREIGTLCEGSVTTPS